MTRDFVSIIALAVVAVVCSVFAGYGRGYWIGHDDGYVTGFCEALDGTVLSVENRVCNVNGYVVEIDKFLLPVTFNDD